MSPRALRLAAGVAVLLMATGGLARAQSVEGGCSTTINGRSPESLTADNAFEVEKDQVVSITGTVPASVANQEDVESTTEITLFAGVTNGVPLETVEGTGPEWGGEAEVPDALFDYAPGIYLVGGEASGTGGWNCSGDGYIEIVGGPWTAALAAGAVFSLAGLFLLKAARGPIRTASDKRVRRAAEGKGLGSTSDFQDAMDDHMTTDSAPDAGPGAESARDRGSVDAGKEGTGSTEVQESMGEKPDAPPTEPTRGTRGSGAGAKSGGGRGALQNLMHDNGATRGLDALGVVAGAVPVALLLTGTWGSASTLVSGLLLASLPASSSTRFWVRGRPITGFFGGLFAGLGIALVLHQFDIWGAAEETMLFLPGVLAVLGALRGWWGRAYRTG